MRRVLASILLAGALLTQTGAAHAHGDEVQLEVIAEEPTDVGSVVVYRVSLTYVNDGDGINGATITATASKGGDLLDPVQMDSTGVDGIYEVAMGFSSSGRWTVQFDSTDPPATAATTFEVEAPPPATEPPPTTSVPATTAVEPEDATLAEDSTDSGDDGPPAFLIVGIVAAGVLMVAAGTALVIRRRREAAGSGQEPPE